jgi:putative ABC transport system permease protein
MNTKIFWIALRNLRHQGVRSTLTLLGVIIGIASIVALISIGQGLQASTTEQFEKLGSNTIFVIPGSLSQQGMPSTISFSDTDIRRIESFANVKSVIPFFSTNSKLKYASQELSVSVMSFDPKKTQVLEESGYVELRDGRSPSEQDVFAVLVGGKLADDGFTRPIKVRSTVEINGKKFKVVGIMKPSASTLGGGGPDTGNGVFITQKAAELTYDNPQPIFMFVQTFTKDEATGIKDKIQRYFDKTYGEKSVTVSTSEQLLEQINQFLGIISTVLVVIAAISLIVGGIGIMNAMIMTVLERTKEIGTMKAIGATNHTILALFLMEAGLIGLVGGIIGSLFGYGIAQGAAAIAQGAGINLLAVATPELFVFVLLFSMLVGMISGAYPAIRAARMDPVEALRYE